MGCWPQTDDITLRLRAWLRLELDDVGMPQQRAAACLRAVVVDAASFQDPLALCALVRSVYPGVPLWVLVPQTSDVPPSAVWHHQVLGLAPRWHVGLAGRADLLQGFWIHADAVVEQCLDAPYWKALERYTSVPPLSFHTRTLGHGHLSSASLADFAGFYGEAYFATETSLATAPLDSLLKPRGAILDAQRKASRAFGPALDAQLPPGAAGTRFVSCGTSTANRVVISACVQPGDFVLADRTCHVSHHYALAYAHARPVFLETFRNTQGFSGPVPVATVRSALRDVLERHNALPAVVILTNPTFDGFLCRPDKVVEAVVQELQAYWMRHRGSSRLARLCESLQRFSSSVDLAGLATTAGPEIFVVAALRRMVFLFDEAWSAAAFFHPRLIEFTAMYAGLKLAQDERAPYAQALRIYATQSTHKSLCALRQGSMLHFRDPLMARPEFHEAFEQSFRAHTTTSPSVNIIASLDVARRHAQLEVTWLQEEAIRLANIFRHEFKPAPECPQARGFFVVSAAQMVTGADADVPPLLPDECVVAPTHVTLSWHYPVDGARMRRRLLERGIQVNKYDQRSLLFIFNVGVCLADLNRLRTALHTLQAELDREHPELAHQVPLLALPRFPGFHGDHDLGFWVKNLGGFERACIDLDPVAPLPGPLPAQPSTHRHVAATFVTPYPPGHPVLIPGQVIAPEDLVYLRSTAIHEILGAEKTNGRLQIPVFVVEVECRTAQPSQPGCSSS